MQRVQEGDLDGWLYQPPGADPRPGLIVLGGSDGGHSAAENTMLLASHGYVALALAYFGTGDLPESLAEIPMEYFIRGVDWLQARPSVDRVRIGILGTSKGAEAALLLASLDGRLRTVVGYTPSSFVRSCICSGDKSSWTYVRGDILLISGKDDLLFPSDEMASMIIKRLRENGFRYQSKHFSCENTGHQIRKSYMPWANSGATARGWLLLGGTNIGNANAQADAWPKVLRFLEESLLARWDWTISSR